MSLRLPPELYRQLCHRVLNRDQWTCRNQSCLLRNNIEIHHIIYRSHQGPDAQWNLVALCNQCHAAMHRGDLRIVPEENQQPPYDADFDLKFERLNGWRPQ